MQSATQTYSDQKFDTEMLEKRREFDRSRPLDRDITKFLISSDRVEGTKVFATDGEKIGHIDRVMLGKRSGRVEYAVMSFGGFLGIGESFAALPWESLDYDTDRSGYVVNIDKDRLREAPRFERDAEPIWDRKYGERVYAYYGIMY